MSGEAAFFVRNTFVCHLKSFIRRNDEWCVLSKRNGILGEWPRALRLFFDLENDFCFNNCLRIGRPIREFHFWNLLPGKIFSNWFLSVVVKNRKSKFQF